jgi:uncharacterized protein (DUF433 family)
MAIRSRRTEEAAITRTPGIRGGSPCIAGTGIRVADVVRRRRMYGQKDFTNRMIENFPHLSAHGIEAALAYYDAHKSEIDEYIAHEDKTAAEWSNPPPSI